MHFILRKRYRKKSGPVYLKSLGVKVVIVMVRNVKKVSDYAFGYGIKKFYGDVDALINDPEVDFLYIVLPSNVQ